MSDVIAKLPKIELHAHLNGSLRPQTVADLARAEGKDVSLVDVTMDSPTEKSLSEYDFLPVNVALHLISVSLRCFKLFDLIYHLTTKPDVIERIAKEVWFW